MPDELSPRRVGRRLLALAAVGIAVAVTVLTGPGLGELRKRVAHASPGWLFAGLGLEVLSTLCYVVIFRAVFCPRMRWRLSYLIGMSEQGANSVLSVSGAGGLALGAWALHRGGMNSEQIGRKSVAFFFLTSLANVVGVVALAALYAGGALGHDPNAALTDGFGAAALAVTLLVLALPWWLGGVSLPPTTPPEASRVAAVWSFARYSLGEGVRGGVVLLRRRSPAVLLGSFGTMAFDLAVLGVCFRAFGYSPPIGVLALGYLIGQLGGNIPVPGGIGGVDFGLIGTFALYHQPLAATTAAVLAYHAIALWVPGLLGSAAFLQLHRTLQRQSRPAATCAPLGEPIAG
ncbi:MAG TPA: lysylphosphatidylglycerol synthase transmembrane domain-containing protein [Frankiaceae bacterium]|nr:lysylphosphatidylglycerol synthase transmembrane domain-containing protein [Frankiaceae bacterium]